MKCCWDKTVSHPAPGLYTGDQDVLAGRLRCSHADDKTRGRHDAIVGAEHRRAKPSGPLTPMLLTMRHEVLAYRTSFRGLFLAHEKDDMKVLPGIDLAGATSTGAKDVGTLPEVLKRFKQRRRLEGDVKMLTESGGEPVGRVFIWKQGSARERGHYLATLSQSGSRSSNKATNEGSAAAASDR